MNSSLLRGVKEDFDWEYYIDLHYDYKRSPNSKNGLELRICCPNCDDDKYKCYVNPDMKSFHCFKCDFNIGNYSLFDFVSKTEGIPSGKALLRLVREYAPTAPEQLPSDLTNPVQTIKHRVIEVSHRSMPANAVTALEASTDSSCNFTPHFKYLAARGFSHSDIEATNMHFVGNVPSPVYNDTGKFIGDVKNRILFPIYYKGYLAGWQARGILAGQEPKYISCPNSDISSTLWPFSPPYTREAVLVEGIIDALAVRKVPEMSAYATFGKSVSQAQMNLLKDWNVDTVTLWWDKKDALREMTAAVEKLKMQFSKVYVLDLNTWPKNKDAGNFLSDSNGTAIIESTLNKRINVYSTLEYAQWTKSF